MYQSRLRQGSVALIFVSIVFAFGIGFCVSQLYSDGLKARAWNSRYVSSNLTYDTASIHTAGSSLLRPDNNSYVAFCLTARDEHPHIREWVLYHHMIGVDKFYIFDEYSFPPLAGVLADLIQAGLVEYNFLFYGEGLERNGTTVQDAKYNTCLQRYGSRHTWMGFMDTDEFVVLQQNETSLPALLQEYEAYGGLVLLYRLFGSSGHIMRPEDGVLNSYTRCRPYTDKAGYGKTIARTNACRETLYVHNCAYHPGFYDVTVWGSRFTGIDMPLNRTVGERAVLHHYISRSMEDWQVKAKRGGGIHSGRRAYGTYIRWYDFMDKDVCLQGLALATQLQARFGELLQAPAGAKSRQVPLSPQV